MKYVHILPLAVFCISLQAQTANTSGAANATEAANSSLARTTAQQATSASATSSAAQTTQATAAATQTTNVSAELTKKIDTKNAKVGDEVTARTISTAKLGDGTKLPKGTKLLGRVTEAHAKSNADQASHLAFSFDRAVLHDGREIPVHAVLTSITGVSALAQTTDDMAMSTPAGSGMAGSSVQTGGGARNGGLLGGVGRTAGGVTNTVGDVGGAVRSDADSVVNGVNATGTATGSVGTAALLNRAPVANMPGVMLSSAASSSSSASLDSANRNITLASGTQMTLDLATVQQ